MIESDYERSLSCVLLPFPTNIDLSNILSVQLLFRGLEIVVADRQLELFHKHIEVNKV